MSFGGCSSTNRQKAPTNSADLGTGKLLRKPETFGPRHLKAVSTRVRRWAGSRLAHSSRVDTKMTAPNSVRALPEKLLPPRHGIFVKAFGGVGTRTKAAEDRARALAFVLCAHYNVASLLLDCSAKSWQRINKDAMLGRGLVQLCEKQIFHLAKITIAGM